MLITKEELANFDLIKAMQDRAELTENIRSYINRSELWRAFCHYVSTAKVCYLLNRSEHPIAVHRGSGASISFREAHLYAPKSYAPVRVEADVFCVYLDITYYDKDDLDSEYPRTHSIDYSVNFPTALMLKFTKKGFDAWVAESKAKAKDDLPDNEMKQLKTLMLKYPKGADALIAMLREKGQIE